jgi:hypothetical protein
LLQEYSKRHRNITRVLNRHCSKLKPLFEELGIDFDTLTVYRKLLIGSYFTHEYSIESAAFLTHLLWKIPTKPKWKTGSAALSSASGRWARGISPLSPFAGLMIDKNNGSPFCQRVAILMRPKLYATPFIIKNCFLRKLPSPRSTSDVLHELEDKLDHHFEYSNLRRIILDSQKLQEDDMNAPGI